MMTIKHIPPFEQIYLLNSELISRANELSGPVITVGGQAVYYWFIYYMNEYPENERPNGIYLHSIDIDYVSKRDNVQHIANIFNVEAIYNKPLNLPSLAMCSLVDKDTHKIKEFQGRLFSNPDEDYKGNLIDIIDRPAGFLDKDLKDDALNYRTEMFLTASQSSNISSSHELVRVLNPISCIRSRLANIKNKVKLDIELEVSRIKSLMIPTFYFLLDKLDDEPFKTAQNHIKIFSDLVWVNDYRRLQVDLNIPLYKILEQLHLNLSDNRKDYGSVPDLYIDRELISTVKACAKQYERLYKNTSRPR